MFLIAQRRRLPMSLIKPRTRGKHLVRHITRLDRQNGETLYAYAAFIGEDAEYVLNQLIDTVLAKDKDFVKWRASHPESFVPRSTRRGHRRTTAAPTTNRATLSTAQIEEPRSSSVTVS
jgi:hypothetical protein